MNLPKTATVDFALLGKAYRDADISFPHLKAVTYAQWALESGWGTSKLASSHKNYGGAKWREYMRGYATPVSYAAHDGRTTYCNFLSHDAWIKGYWERFKLEPAYQGWHYHTRDGDQFIEFIGPIWLGMGDAKGRAYVKLVSQIRDQWKMIDQFKPGVLNEDSFTLDELRMRFADYARTLGL